MLTPDEIFPFLSAIQYNNVYVVYEFRPSAINFLFYTYSAIIFFFYFEYVTSVKDENIFFFKKNNHTLLPSGYGDGGD